MMHRPENGRWPAARGRVPGACAGRTFIELLAVLAIILILTTLYWGSNSGSRQHKLLGECQKNLQKIYIAMDIYANDHAGKFPEVVGARSSEEALAELVPHYTVDTSVFICPGSKDSALPAGEPFRTGKISYAYYMGCGTATPQQALMSDRLADAQSKAAGQPMFSTTGKPPGNNHDKYGGNLLLCDGSVQSVAARTPFAIGTTQSVVLLNPR
jgi:hypothetical protein